MRQLRPVLIAIGILVAIGLLLWLVSTLATFYAGVSSLSPVLARLLVTLLVLLLVGAIGVIIYYARLFLRPRRSRPLPPPPKTTTDAAIASLGALERQIDQIQDQVAREALWQKSEQLAGHFQQQAFHIVLFGSGSVGKTSLANALMGENAGLVAAPKGTTTLGQTYRLAVSNLERELWLTDSPGILEVGRQDAETRQLATVADLLLYVVDNDLHRAEYEAIDQLLAVGKRSILVFNKSDLYADAEKAQILQRLRERLAGRLHPADVIAIAAHPQPILINGPETFQPDPDISDLIDRMVSILRTEGEDLVADNILLQTQRLTHETRDLLSLQRQQQADAIIDRYQWISAGVLAATPLPVVDLLATAAVNTQMVVELGSVYGIDISIADARTLALSLAKTLTSLGIVKGALQLLALGLQANLATAVVSKLLQGCSAAYLTRIAGKSFIEYFKQNQDWGEGGIQTVVDQQYQLNRRDQFVRQFVQSVTERVLKVK